MAWDSTKSAPSAQQPEPSTQCLCLAQTPRGGTVVDLSGLIRKHSERDDRPLPAEAGSQGVQRSLASDSPASDLSEAGAACARDHPTRFGEGQAPRTDLIPSPSAPLCLRNSTELS